MKIRLRSLAVCLAVLPAMVAMGADGPTGGRLSLIEIVEKLEKAGYGPFSEVSWDDGRWEIDVQQGKSALELKVDATTGEILSQHPDDAEPQPPAGSLPLSQLLRKLEAAGYSNFDDVSFGRRYWEVDAIKGGEEHECQVDPKTGEVISDRIDD